MKTTISVAPFNKAVQSLKRNINNKSALPILECILFEFEEKNLLLTSSDLENVHKIKIETLEASSGVFAVPGELLAETIKNITDISIDLEFTKTHLIIKSLRGEYEIPIYDVNEFPKTVDLNANNKVAINSELLTSLLSKASKFAGSDDLRPAMSSVLLSFRENETVIAATDANKLFKHSIAESFTNERFDILVPKKTTQLLSGLTNVDELASVRFNETNAEFDFGNQIITCRLVDAKYPNFEAVIPKYNEIEVRVSKKELELSLKTLGAYSNQTTREICLDVKMDKIQIQSQDIDYSRKAKETISCENQTSEIRIGFNSRYLSECVSSIESDFMILYFTAPNRACVIKPESAENTTVLVMPVILNN